MISWRRASCCIRNKIFSYRSISRTSVNTNEDSKRKNLPSRKLFEELTEKLLLDERISQSGRRPFEVMIEKPIIVKKFFLSEVGAEDVQYPEVMTKNDADKWKEVSSQTSDYFAHGIEYDEKGISSPVYDTFKRMNLFGCNVPKEFDGQAYTHTQLTMTNEMESQNIVAAMVLNVHRLVCATISEMGTKEQCTEYLPKLASGNLIGTVAFQEWNSAEKIALNTRAEYDDDTDEWCLNGSKSFVVNAADSNLFLVIAQTETNDWQSEKKDSLTVFIVDGSLPGIKVQKRDKTIGISNLFQASVTFNDVILGNDAVLSVPGTGQYIQQKVMMNSRINQGVLNLSQMKSILEYMLNMVGSIEQETEAEMQQSEANTLRLVIGKYVCSIYALESMLYFTTGIMDKYDNTNIDLETAIFKTYSQDQLLNMVTDLLNFVDPRVMSSEHPLNGTVRNAIQFKFGEPKNDLKLHIGNTGIQHRLKRLIEEVAVKKNKDFLIKTFVTDRQLDMYEPEIRSSAKSLFSSIELLQLGAATLIEMEARDLPKRHTEIQKLADTASCIYASFACLLRGNRSLKLKLPNAQDESIIINAICDRNAAEVKRLMQYIEDGPIKTFEKYHEFVTELFLKKEYTFPAHPLTRNF